MDTKPLLLPASIVIAGGLVGAGLFLGLRDRSPDPGRPALTGVTLAPLAPALTVATSTAASATEPARTPPPGVSPEMQARLDERAAAAVARERPRLAKECWEPSVRKNPAPATLAVPLRFLFDPSGKQIDFAVAEARDPNRRDVIECVQKAGLVVSAEPSGQMMATQLSLSFP